MTSTIDPTPTPVPSPTREQRLGHPAPSWLLPAALVGAAGISAIALFDAATHGMTGEYSQFQDDGSLGLVGSAIHGVGYLVLTAVLFLRAAAIDRGSRVVRWFRRLTAVSMGLLAAVFLAGTALQTPSVEEIGGIVGSVAFLTMFLFGAALGIALLATGRRTPAAWSLVGILGAIGLMVILGFVASNWVHPAYPETAVHFGVALLALRQSSAARTRPGS